ncbi:MAG: hypothetical protein JSU86_11325 [Phycisphaerales bacterium]|nr:MAG: hypothetical protein JSU86_11325 [Phycisphaerales bacterium]
MRSARGPKLWPGLDSGQYCVGYTLRQIRDESRLFPIGEDSGRAAPRPIQISIWYPGEKMPASPQVTLTDYLADIRTELDFQAGPALADEVAAELTETLSVEGVDNDRLKRALARRCLAVRDRTPLAGPFPLVLFAPGAQASPSQNPVLCEFLASHGFVVASIPSIGPNSRAVPTTHEGIEAGVRDLALTLEYMLDKRTVRGAAGVAGFSWGGLTGPLLAMRDARIGAVASLDGALMQRQHLATARTMLGYNASALRRPIMILLADARQWDLRTVEFFHEAGDGKQDGFLVRFHDLYHGDFASSIIELVLHNLVEPGRDVSRVDTAFVWQCRYLLAFFNTYLKKDEGARAFLAREPEANGVPVNLLSIQRR